MRRRGHEVLLLGSVSSSYEAMCAEREIGRNQKRSAGRLDKAGPWGKNGRSASGIHLTSRAFGARWDDVMMYSIPLGLYVSSGPNWER